MCKKKNKSKDSCYNSCVDIMTEVFNKFILIKLPFHRPSYLPDVLGNLLFGDNSRYISCDEDNESFSTSCCVYINGMMMTDLETIKNHNGSSKRYVYWFPFCCGTFRLLATEPIIPVSDSIILEMSKLLLLFSRFAPNLFFLQWSTTDYGEI